MSFNVDALTGLGGGRRIPVAGGGGGGIRGPRMPTGSEFVDSVTVEADLSAVDTWTSLGTIDVPIDASHLVKMVLSDSPDFGTSALGVRYLTGYRLRGNGLVTGGLHRYLGHAGAITIETAGVGCDEVHPTVYPMNLQVKGGNQLTVEATMLGEDSGDSHAMLQAVFASGGNPGGFVDGDFREGDISDIDTPTSLTAVGSASEGDFDVPIEATNLAKIATLMAPDYGTDADIGVPTAGRGTLRGNGLAMGGTYEFVTPASFFGGTSSSGTAAGAGAAWRPYFEEVDMPIKGGNTIEALGEIKGTDPGAVTFAVGLLYD